MEILLRKICSRLRSGLRRVATGSEEMWQKLVLRRGDRELAARRQFYRVFGRYPNLRHPETFNEKLQWLKLNYVRKELPLMVDKFAVREFVSKRVGERYLNTLLAAWATTSEISWDLLPDRFVMKANHGSAWNVVCTDKRTLDRAAAERKFAEWLASDYFTQWGEWPYHYIFPRIVVEAFLAGPNGLPPEDYKLFCFNGEPRFVQVDVDRFSNHRRNYYDRDWKLQPFGLQYPLVPNELPKPAGFDEMVEIAAALSAGLPFARVDLYQVGNRVIFGEITFFPEAALGVFTPEGWDRKLGDHLVLPEPLDETALLKEVRQKRVSPKV